MREKIITTVIEAAKKAIEAVGGLYDESIIFAYTAKMNEVLPEEIGKVGVMTNQGMVPIYVSLYREIGISSSCFGVSERDGAIVFYDERLWTPPQMTREQWLARLNREDVCLSKDMTGTQNNYVSGNFYRVGQPDSFKDEMWLLVGPVGSFEHREKFNARFVEDPRAALWRRGMPLNEMIALLTESEKSELYAKRVLHYSNFR